MIVVDINAKRNLKKKRRIEQIPDTPENVAKALFGIKLAGKKSKAKESSRDRENC